MTARLEERRLLDAIGPPGTARIFTHNITSLVDGASLGQVLAGHRRFDERALLLAGPDDVVCVVGDVDPGYLDFLHGLGVGPGADRVIQVGDGVGVCGPQTLPELLVHDERAIARIAGLLSSAGRVALSPYIVSRAEVALAGELERALGRPIDLPGGPPGVVALVNDKLAAFSRARELGVPVAPGEIVQMMPAQPPDVGPLEAAVARHGRHTGRAIVRGPHGTSGSALLVASSGSSALRAELAAFALRQPSPAYLVQAMLDLTGSPNLQLFVDRDRGIAHVGTSDQRLGPGLAHAGNVSPSLARTLPEMLESAGTIASWLASEGFTGLVGFDFVEHAARDSGQRRHALAEVNARMNAATYPLALMERLSAGQSARGAPSPQAFLSAAVPVRGRCFRELRERCGDALFDAARGSGAVPYNTGRLAHGECDLALLGPTRAAVEELWREARDMLRAP